MATSSGNGQKKVANNGYFYAKRQTQFQNRGGAGLLSDNTFTPDVPALADLNTQKDAQSGLVAQHQGQKKQPNARGPAAGTNKQPTNKQPKASSQRPDRQAHPTGHQTINNIQNIRAIDNFIDNNIHQITGTQTAQNTAGKSSAPGGQKVQGGNPNYYPKSGKSVGPPSAANSAA